MDIYFENRVEIIKLLKILWNFMKLESDIQKCDLIIGCGCSDKNIPVRCAELLKEGYAPKILFAGGVGKLTKDEFNKSEAEIFKDIAVKEGVPEESIILETNSTNTGDNFRFSLEIIKEQKLDIKKIIIVHKPICERRTLSSALAIIKDKEIMITSPTITFEEFIQNLEENKEKIIDKISVIVGDIQRLVVYPMVGFQLPVEVPNNVISAFEHLKKLGFDKYIIEKEKIDELIEKHGLVEGYEKIYFL